MRYVHNWKEMVLAFFLMTTGCAESPTNPDKPVTKRSVDFAFITTTDFETGSSSVIWLDGSYTVAQDVTPVHSDAVARYYEGLIYVVNQFGADNIQILDPGNNFVTVRQFSVGNGSNPKDIAFVNKTKAYVTRYSSTELWIVDPSSGSHIGTIDLSSLSDEDGIPEMDRMIRIGSHLFITVQRIDRDSDWGPVGLSYLAVVDVNADTLIDTNSGQAGTQPITLTGTNPFSDIEIDPATGKLCVACVGDWGVQDGGIELVNQATFESEGFLLTEAVVLGDITDVELVSEQRGYVIITDVNYHNTLMSFNPQTGEIIETVYAPRDFVLQDIELSPAGQLFLADRSTTNPGIRIYDAETGEELTTAPINVRLPPYDITFGVTEETTAKFIMADKILRKR